MKKPTLLVIFLVFNIASYAQNRSNVWVFGDSTGINFNGTPSVFSSSIDSRGSCVSISDTSGTLEFYATTMPYSGSNPAYSTKIFNFNHSLVQNGDSIFGKGWYHELITIPMPGNDSLYYLFSVGVSSEYGLKYSVIDMKANSGLGEVIQKNVPLQSFPMVDCLTAVKHGNGRDWWLIFRRWDDVAFVPNNEFHTYFISPAGITNYNVQMIGETHRSNQGELTFSPTGDMLINTDGMDLLELFEFDRCSGLLSNPNLIHPAGGPLDYHLTWSSAFSPNGNILYVSTSKDTNYIYQLDLTAANIYASRINLDTLYSPPVQPGSLKLAPDGKIYLSCAYTDGLTFNYPYNDTEYDTVNMYLSVINYPDSLGTACGYAPFSFYLGGKRTYWGLPNNPDYDLGSLVGSPCDTLVGIQEPVAPTTTAALFLYYAPNWQTVFINANKLKGTNYALEVIDITGKSIFRESGKLNPPYFTKNLNCSGFAKGMYVVNFVTDKERLTKKFIVQ